MPWDCMMNPTTVPAALIKLRKRDTSYVSYTATMLASARETIQSALGVGSDPAPNVPAKMAAVRVYTPAKSRDDIAQVLKVEQVPTPGPGEWEYLIHLRLRPVHPADRLSVMGQYPGAPDPSKWPMTPGLDGMGVIAKAGQAALKFTVGQRVAVAGFPLERGNGTWAEYMVLKEGDIAGIPDDVTDEQAAQFWTNPVSMWYMLNRLDTVKGDYVLFSGAHTALAQMGMKLAHSMGLKPIGVTATDTERDALLKSGAPAAASAAALISLQSERLTRRVRALTGGAGARAALDCVGGDVTGHLACALAPTGSVIVCGMAAGDVAARVPLGPLLLSRLRLEGFWLNGAVEALPPEARTRIADDVMDAIARGAIDLSAAAARKTFALSDVAAAAKEAARAGGGGDAARMEFLASDA
ncbi:chaperonin 10-like protein [Tribonema minus]|uniref:Chaperonin 10-like protein n=1 Tax=Tribonema minus TaxID=303371 RepID=A0A835YTN2_9STRA|nr:chaperonin 10-like protein [Tribonema minus]